jgi:hypothetical protein
MLDAATEKMNALLDFRDDTTMRYGPLTFLLIVLDFQPIFWRHAVALKESQLYYTN